MIPPGYIINQIDSLIDVITASAPDILFVPIGLNFAALWAKISLLISSLHPVDALDTERM
jgi:hypothetical protein